jgi:carboxymethylenebutenolidase
MQLRSRADGFEFGAYHAAPRDARRGGLVLIQEVFGVTQGIRDLADGFAEQGYDVLAPQMFDRCQRDFQAERSDTGLARGLAFVDEVGWDRAIGDVQACIDALAGPVFVVGFCYGGTLAWLAAARCTGLAAASCYYGRLIADFANEQPRCPTILHFGKADTSIPPARRDVIVAAHPDLPIYLYEADHGFFSPDRPGYDPEPAGLSRLRTLQLFHRSAGDKVEM